MRVVICGSLAHPDLLDAAAQPYLDAGEEVVVPRPDDTRTPQEHDQAWLRHIERADLVVVVRKPDGSLGASACREVAHACDLGTFVRWWSP